MKIRRVILKGVRNFKDFDHTFEDEWSGRVPDAILLSGPNGGGKTTLLNAIADLWLLISKHLQESPAQVDSSLPLMGTTLANSQFAAIEILGLEDEPLWIGIGNDQACREFTVLHEKSHRVLSRRSAVVGQRSLFYARPGAIDGQAQRYTNIWLQGWAERLTKNILGKEDDLANIVYLESETRILATLSEQFTTIPEADEFYWLARYEPTTSRKGSLQNYLFNLKVVDEIAFKNIVEQVNQFLPNKNISDFDKRTRQLMVQVKGNGEHPIEDLSSGEKQVLLMLATVTRWLRPGGILLIDEPDLHLHEALTTAFVNHLRRMITDQGGQLILASHAPALRRDFTDSHSLRLGKTELSI